MKCFNHNDREATATCSMCGKFLCTECASQYNPPLCTECVNKNANDVLKENIKMLLIGLALFIVAFIFTGSLSVRSAMNYHSMFERIILSLMFAGIPFGWNALSRITSNIFVALPIVGYLFYLWLKFILSLFIGIFIMLFRFAVIIFHIVQALMRKKQINAYDLLGNLSIHKKDQNQ